MVVRKSMEYKPSRKERHDEVNAILHSLSIKPLNANEFDDLKRYMATTNISFDDLRNNAGNISYWKPIIDLIRPSRPAPHP